MDFINTGDGFLDLINGGNLLDFIYVGNGLLVFDDRCLRCIVRGYDLQQFKRIAGCTEGLGGFLLPDSHDKHPCLPQALGQLGKIRIAGNQAETIYISGI